MAADNDIVHRGRRYLLSLYLLQVCARGKAAAAAAAAGHILKLYDLAVACRPLKNNSYAGSVLPTNLLSTRQLYHASDFHIYFMHLRRMLYRYI